MKRLEFTVSTKKEAFRLCCKDGIPHCAICGLPIKGGPEYDHKQAAGLGGDNSLANCQVICKPCHRHKTHKSDTPRMRKADAVKKKAMNIVRDKQPIPARGFVKAGPKVCEPGPKEAQLREMRERRAS